MGAFKGEGGDDYEEDDAFDRVEAGFDRGLKGSQHAYAAQPILGGASPGAYQRSSRPASNAATESAEVFGQGDGEDVGPETRPSYSSGYKAPTAPPQAQGLASYASSSPAEAEAEPKGPGLIERFKETKAYDKLQDELSTLGERALEELSRTARTVVVPALLGKLKGMLGLDLSGQGGGAQQQGGSRQQAAGTGSQPFQSAYPGGSASQGSASGQGEQGGGGTTDPAGTSARAAAGGTEGYGAS
jgi:hypothetical protein